MASLREQILAAWETTLDGHADKPAGATVHRFRTRPIEKDDLPAVVLYVTRETTDDRAASALDRMMTVRAEARVQTSAATPPDTALDATLIWIVKATTADPTFGGLAMETTEQGTQWVAEEGDKIIGAAAVDFEIAYQTLRTDLESGP